MPFRQSRMVEIIVGGVRHADFLHHPPGTDIFWNRKRDHLRQLQRRKCKSQRRPRTFRRITTIPVGRVETPANLNAWGKMSLETRYGKSNESRERCNARNLNGPEPKTMLVEMSLNTVGK